MDEFIDQLLREDRVTDIQLPRLQVNTEQIQFSGHFEKKWLNQFITFTRYWGYLLKFRGKVNIINGSSYIRIEKFKFCATLKPMFSFLNC